MTASLLEISKRTLRRFVLGRQGLWPGRRWRGVEGTAAAIEACEAVQLDPLMVVARSHDITLWGRVRDYRPEHLDRVMYGERRFFDYGGALFAYPMGELPYWRVHMRRRAQDGRWAQLLSEQAGIVEAVRIELKRRGPLGNRDLSGTQRVRSYRGRKDTAVALYALWITGEVMVHHRRRFERVYDFQENIVPTVLNRDADEAQAAEYFGRKIIAHNGIVRARPWAVGLADALHRPISVPEGRERLEALIANVQVTPVRVEDEREAWYVLSEDLPLFAMLDTGGIPFEWQPLGPTTLEEAVFLAPLDIVSARGRAKRLFDFDYVWEVYKPKAQRRWGYYTLPILYGDELVARVDLRLERSAKLLKLEGFWLEDGPRANADFGAALARGMLSFAQFLEAEAIDLEVIQPPGLRQATAAGLKGWVQVIGG